MSAPCYSLEVGGRTLTVPACAPGGPLDGVTVRMEPVENIPPSMSLFVDPHHMPPSETRRRFANSTSGVAVNPVVSVRPLMDEGLEFSTEEHEGSMHSVTLPVPVYSFEPCVAYEANENYPTSLPDPRKTLAPAHDPPLPYHGFDAEVQRGRVAKNLQTAPRNVRTLSITGHRLGPKRFYWSWLPPLTEFRNVTHLFLRHVTIDALARDSIENLPCLRSLVMIDCAVSDMRPPGWRENLPNGTRLSHLTINAALLRANPKLQEAAYDTVVLHMTDPTAVPPISVRLDDRREASPAALTLVYPKYPMSCHTFSPPRVQGVRTLVIDSSPDGALPPGLGPLERLRIRNTSVDVTRIILSQNISTVSLELPDGMGYVTARPRLVQPSQCGCTANRVFCAPLDPYAPRYETSIPGVKHVETMTM